MQDWQNGVDDMVIIEWIGLKTWNGGLELNQINPFCVASSFFFILLAFLPNIVDHANHFIFSCSVVWFEFLSLIMFFSLILMMLVNNFVSSYSYNNLTNLMKLADICWFYFMIILWRCGQWQRTLLWSAVKPSIL